MTKEKFHAFVKVQRSGKSNMWDQIAVTMLSNYKVNKEDHLDIISNYDKYLEEYGDLRRKDLTAS